MAQRFRQRLWDFSAQLTVLEMARRVIDLPRGAETGERMDRSLLVADFNPKERQRLAELHGRFKGGTFSETEVSAVLVLLREKSGGGPILELAHSIAHSERNSGEFFRRVRDNQSLLNDLGKRAGVIDARYIFSDTDFATNLNDTLSKHGFEVLDRSIIDLIFLCGMSLLQGSSVKGGKTFGELHLRLTSEHFELRCDMPVEHNGKTVRAMFPLSAVSNRWLPICNPRAHLDAAGPVTVKVENFVPVVDGFKAFEVHIERAPPIQATDLAALVEMERKLSRTSDGLLYTPTEGLTMPLRYEDGRLTVPGWPEFFRGGSEYEAVLKMIHRALGACVHDDGGAHWFLPLALAPDGFHSHWVGRGSPTCTRPM
jgi:hypothetical protein